MNSSVLVLLGIVAVLLVGGAFAVTIMDNVANVADNGGSGTFQKIANKVDQVTSSDSSYGSAGNDGGSAGDILSDIIKPDGQNGGSLREVTYKDGGFRQFDVDTGDMIGSSYDEDQEELGVVDGNLE